MQKFFDSIDLLQNPTENIVIERLNDFPGGAIKGRQIYHTVFNSIFICINGDEESKDTTLIINWKQIRSSEVTGTIAPTDDLDIEILDKALYESIEWNLAIKDTVAGNFYASKITITHDGTAAYYSEYAIVGDKILFDIDISIVGSNIVFNIVNNDANSIDVRLLRN